MSDFALETPPKVEERKILVNGETRLARIIWLGEEEGLITTQIAELLNVAESTVRSHIKKHAVCARTLSAHIKHSLKDSNVIPIKSHGGLFVSREGIEVLVKVIDTDEAWEVYRQLWNDARELAVLKPKYIELQAKHEITIAELSLALKENESLAGVNTALIQELRSKDEELIKAQAKLQASIDFIENKGKGRRKCRHSVVEFEFAGVNIFEGPQYIARVKKLERAEMNEREQDVFGLQKGISSIRGIAGSMEQRSERLGINNPEVREALKQLSAASDEAYHRLIPEAGRVLGLKDGESISYLN
ncbi:hypothetical protein [Oligoflexus tunisiensis]|uniref:hypothetical protein n=1 Tax=Oligoflexus tunisiensis TaxID=708132 RepID=UPI00114CE1A8|nr:hypothetical protein [Oligoflexus tunisiensis]